MSFEKFGLDAGILDSLKKEGFKKPTPIQSRAIPSLLAGNDVMGGAETGTGKTAAFTLPILNKLCCTKRKGKNPRALIMVPTRELASQVGENVRTYGRYLKLETVELYGGVSIAPQIQKLSRGVDIVIATPGRLIDLLGQKAVKLNEIEMLVLDEADRMLDMGFIHDIKNILGHVPKERQTMMFSATFSNEIKRLADRMLIEPELIEMAPNNSPAKTIKQLAYAVDSQKKLKLLYRLIKDEGWYQVLVFTKTKRRAQSLSLQLAKKGVPTAAIHGDKTQGARTRALKDFKSGKIQALVATDIAARGIDINQLSHVVNFQMPQQAEDYIHRIGRTGRAGSTGVAVSLVSSEDVEMFQNIERHLKKQIETVTLEDFDSEKLDLHAASGTYPSRAQGGGRSGMRGNSSGRPSGRPGMRGNSSDSQSDRPSGRSGMRGNSSYSQSDRPSGRPGMRGNSSYSQSDRPSGRPGMRGNSSYSQSDRPSGRSGMRGNSSERAYGRFAGQNPDRESEMTAERQSSETYRGRRNNSSGPKRRTA